MTKHVEPYLQHSLVKKMLMFGCAVAAIGFSYIAWKKYGKGIVESLFPRKKDNDGKMDNDYEEIEGREPVGRKAGRMGGAVDGSDVDGNHNEDTDDDYSEESDVNCVSGDDDSDGESYYVEDSGADGDCRVDSDIDSDDGYNSRYTAVLNNFGRGDASDCLL